jgi:hypothetical protein
MHWEENTFALPLLLKDRKWFQIFTTELVEKQAENEVENQREITVSARTIAVFVGR